MVTLAAMTRFSQGGHYDRTLPERCCLGRSGHGSGSLAKYNQGVSFWPDLDWGANAPTKSGQSDAPTRSAQGDAAPDGL